MTNFKAAFTANNFAPRKYCNMSLCHFTDSNIFGVNRLLAARERIYYTATLTDEVSPDKCLVAKNRDAVSPVKCLVAKNHDAVSPVKDRVAKTQ